MTAPLWVHLDAPLPSGNVLEVDLRSGATRMNRSGDGWADDGEFLDNVECADCGEGRQDQRRCDACSVEGCRCEITPSRELCDRWSGGDLCQDCADTYTCAGRCPDCDPPDPRDF